MIGEALQAWIGRSVTYHAPEEIGRAGIRLFALAMQDDNPLHQDEAFARSTVHGGIIAPPTLVCETNQPCRRTADESGYFGHHWDLPIKGQLIRGGNDYEFHRPLRPEDRISVTWTLTEITERETRSGVLTFVVSEARYTDQHGELLAVNRETNILRP